MGWEWLALGCGVLLVLGLLTAGVAVWLLGRQRRTLVELSQGLEALGEGKPVRLVYPPPRGPAARLAEQFNETAARIEERIAGLEADRLQLRAVLEGMAEGVIAVDSRRRLVFANPAARRLFGLTREGARRLVAELIRSPDVQQAVEATLTVPGLYRGEMTMPGRESPGDLAARVLHVVGTPLPGRPPSGAVLVFHDLTELRRLERMRQDFVANASHELKTPLASIKAYTESLLDWALRDENYNQRYLQQIDEHVDRLNEMIHDMLSLARLESSQEVDERRPLPLAPVVRACAEMQRGRAVAKQLVFTLELDGLDSSVLILANEEAVRQILDNLIDNAIKYTPTGGGVRLASRALDLTVELEVADTGVGIPRDDLPRIFERFYRVDKARSREMGGTGLGLSIVKHQVQMLGGGVTVESRLNLGTTFKVWLPRYLPPA